MVLDARAEGCTVPGARWKRYSHAGLSAGPAAGLGCSKVSTRPATQRPFCSLCSPAAQCQQLRRWNNYAISRVSHGHAGLSAGRAAGLGCPEVSTRPVTQRPFRSPCSPAAQCQQLRGCYFSSQQ